MMVMLGSSDLARSVKNGELDAAVFVADSEQEHKGMLWTPLYTEPRSLRWSERWGSSRP